MAKAGTSVSDPIWLGDALRLAQPAIGSRNWAEGKLRRWLVTGELPWICKTWAGRQKYTEKGLAPADGPSKGDPVFFRTADIDWDNSSAREAIVWPLGAQAVGIQVSRTRLLELLSGGTREVEKEGGRQQRRGGQMPRVLRALKKLFPPDGKVPDDVPTETVKGRVNDELAPENERLGLGEASWDSVNRALGRAPRRR